MATLGGMRHVALWLALFALCGQFMGAAHLLLVPHAVCVEHGELIHVHDHAVVAAHAESSTSVYRGIREAAGYGESHDHCMASALRREQLVLHKAPSTLVLIGVAHAVAHVERALPVPKPITILMLAPKSSPPTLAA